MPGGLRPLVAVAAAGLLVRVVYTLTLGQDVPLGVSDATFYHFAGNRLADGDGFVDPWKAFATGSVEPTAHHPPGWPAVLALVSLLGGTSQLAHRLAGCVIGSAAVLLAGLVGRRLAGPRAGLVAAVIVALHPTLVAADGSLMAETLAGAGVLSVLLAVLRLRDAPGWRWALAAGVTIGAAALVRAEALLYLPLLVAPLAWRRGAALRSSREGARLAALAALGAAVVIGPWTARNAVQVGGLIPISINDSTVIAGANCERSYHGPNLGSWSLECVRFGTEGLSEPEAARVWRSRGVSYARDNLPRAPVVVAVRVLRTWGIWEPTRSAAEGRHRGVQQAGNVAWLAVLLPAGAAGAVVLARRGRWEDLWIVGAPVLVATTVSALGFGMLRFRHGMELSAAILLGVAVSARLGRRPELHDHAS